MSLKTKIGSITRRTHRSVARLCKLGVCCGALLFVVACSDGVQLGEQGQQGEGAEPSPEPTPQQPQPTTPTEPQEPQEPSSPVQPPTESALGFVHNDGFEGSFFSGSGQCSTCHNDMTDTQGQDISIVDAWSTSMMANAARDPYWIAKVEAEMARNPQLEDQLNDTCSRCHTPMANDTARKDGSPIAILGDEGFLNKDNPLFDHAMEGVSCTLCHQVEDDGLLGTVEGTSGNFSVPIADRRSNRPAYGPYVDPNGVRMQAESEFNPVFGPHMATSETCAACHDLRTPEFGQDTAEGTSPASFFPEQMVYSEWKNSAFAVSDGNERTCQSCHMPEVDGLVNIASSGGAIPREGFSQHTFLGPNTVMQSMLMNNAAELGISVPAEEFEKSIVRNRAFIKTSASVDILSAEVLDGTLTSRVRVRNLAGHKLPSGFASRRAHIHFVVTDDSGAVVFESGRPNADGSVVGVATDADSATFEQHYEAITAADQVQVYEAIMGDVADQVTHTLMNATQYLKDNRLLPDGFDKASAADDIRTRGLALNDTDFDAGGDEVEYRVAVSGVGQLQVSATLVYQPLAFGHLQDLFQNAFLPNVSYFKGLFESASLKAETIAGDSVQAVFR